MCPRGNLELERFLGMSRASIENRDILKIQVDSFIVVAVVSS